MRFSQLLTLAAAIPSTLAAFKGFNYGATYSDGSLKGLSDYEGEFNSAKNLQGASGYNAARLFTTVQGDTQGPIAAIQAAINTQTHLLLGLWASAGDASFGVEINALTAAINQYGTAFTDLIIGISVGSEDVYRITDLGIASKAGPGATPEVIIDYIGRVRSAIAGTPAAGKPVGHVDTYNVWTNTSFTAGLVGAVDFLGVDAYPYYETAKANTIDNAASLFFDDYDQAVAASQGKPVWLTETGWPNQGPTLGQAVPSIENAQRYYKEVACRLFDSDINTFWYILQDQQPVVRPTGQVFGVTGKGVPPPTTPLYSLAC